MIFQYMFIKDALYLSNLYPSLKLKDRLKILARLIFCVETIITILERYLPKRGSIVDLGCGYGLISHLICAKYPERNVVGVDMSSHRIGVAKSSNVNKDNLRFYEGDIKDFHIPQCDAIVIIDALYMLSYQDQEAVIKNCHKNLRDAGILIIKDNYKSLGWRYFYAYAEEKIKTKIGVYGPESKGNTLDYWKIGDLLGLLENIRFRPEVMKLRSFLPYPGVIYVCHKKSLDFF